MPSVAGRIRNLDRNGDGELNEELRNAAEARSNGWTGTRTESWTCPNSNQASAFRWDGPSSSLSRDRHDNGADFLPGC